MFKEQKTNTVVLALVAILGVLLVAPTAKAELDIDWICITSCKSHLNSVPVTFPWRFEIWVYVADPGSLNYINVYKPGASTPFATMYEEGPSPRWGDYDSPISYSSLADLVIDYPNGLYTFEFYNSSHVLLRSVALDYSNLSIPVNPVDFTYPSVDGQTGIPTNPTCTWTVDPGDGNALMMGLEDGVSYKAVPVSMTTTSWAPGPLQPNDECELEVSVCTVKNWGGGPAFPTDTVDDDEFQYSLMIEYLNEINFFTGAVSDHVLKIEMSSTYNYGFPGDLLYYEFDTWIQVDPTVVSGSMRRPDGTDYPMTYESDGLEAWLGVYRYISDPITWDGFGPGTYTFTVNYAGGFDSTSVEYQLPGGAPIPYVTQEPQLTYPSHDAVNVPLQCTFLFDSATNPDHTIAIWVEPVSGTGLSYDIGGLPYNTSSHGPVTLSPETLYEGGYSINHCVITTNADGIPAVMDTDAETQIHFTTASYFLSGWVLLPGVPDIGYSLDEKNFVYFYSTSPVMNYNITTGQWVEPGGWLYFNWPFLYELDTSSLIYAIPPESGLWVFHFSTAQWEVLPQIIP